MWIKEKECYNIIKECWSDEMSNDIFDKMGRCCIRLEQWGGRMIQELRRNLISCRREMQQLRSRRDALGVGRYGEVRWKYLKLLAKQETYRSQRAKQFWLRDRDKNTRFFHKYASTRKEHNKIKRLKDDQGVWQELDQEIQLVITRYFENIFTTADSGEQMSDRVKFQGITEEQSHNFWFL